MPTFENPSQESSQEQPEVAVAENKTKRNICEICHEDYYNPEALSVHYCLDHKTVNNGDSDEDL